VGVAERAIDAFNQHNLHAYDDVFTQDLEWLPAFPGTVEGDGCLCREGIEKYVGEINDT